MPPSEPSCSDEAKLVNDGLLQVHLAEYQALTNRCSYWVTMQVALLPLFLIAIGIVAQMWGNSPNRPVLLWGAMVVIQLLVITYLHVALEIYRAVCYVECDLRPMVSAIGLGRALFWRYEAFLARRRRKGPIWEEYILPQCSIAAIALIAFRFAQQSLISYVSLAANLLLFVLIFADTVRLVRLRQKFTECALGA